MSTWHQTTSLPRAVSQPRSIPSHVLSLTMGSPGSPKDGGPSTETIPKGQRLNSQGCGGMKRRLKLSKYNSHAPEHRTDFWERLWGL